MNDERIIKAIKGKSESAISEVITRYSRLVWSVADAVLGNIGSVQDIEDCVAEVFVFLWEHPERYDPNRGKLKTWLCIVTRSQALDRCRELARRKTVPLDDPAFIDQLGIQEEAERIDAQQLLAAAIKALAEPDREILIRRYYYEQKPRQIALALNMSVKQVDNRLYRTKLRLRQAVAD